LRLVFVWSLLVLCPTLGFAAFELRETDLWMGKSAASLAQCDEIHFSSFYTQIYSLKELTYLGTGFTFPNPLGGSSIGSTQFGNSLYQERKIVFSHGFNFRENLSLGFNLKGIFLTIQDYGSDSTIQLDGSLKVQLNKTLEFSTTLWNLNKASLSNGKENLPTGFSSALQKEFFSKLNISLEINRTDPNPFDLRTSISFPLHNSFHIQAGFKDRPTQFIGGFKVKLHDILLDYNYIQSSSLPGYHQFTLSFFLF